MNTKEILTKAKEIISKPEKWHRGDFVGEGGNCFCIMGAIGKAQDFDFLNAKTFDIVRLIDSEPCMKIRDALRETHPNRGIGDVNDDSSTTHDDVMTIFDKAITLA